MKKLHIAFAGAFVAFLLLLSSLSAVPAMAQCPEDDPDCPLEPPQSEQIDPDPVEGDGSSGGVSDPGALVPVESEIQGGGPAIIDPVPLAPKGAMPPDFNKIQIPMRWQEPTDVSCGVQALGMALDGLGGGSPSSSAILTHLQDKDMMYDFGTGVEELAYAAQNFGYEGTRPFHNWSLSDLRGEISQGRTPVVAIGSNGAGVPGHFVTLTGISPDGSWISYNDPTLGEQTIAIEEFNELWAAQGNSGVAVRKVVLSSEEDLIPWVAFAATLMAIISQTPLALRRMGIGGRLMSGAGTPSRRKPKTKRSTPSLSLGGVPSRAAKAISRVKRRVVRPRDKQTQPPPRDPSPQMGNIPQPRMLLKERGIDDPPPPEPTGEDRSLLDRIADQISNPEFSFDLLTDEKVSTWLRSMEDLPSLPIMLPWLQGFGPPFQSELIWDRNLVQVIDDWAGPIVKKIDLNVGVRTFGRTIGDASFAPLFGIGWGLSLLPEQIQDFRDGAELSEHLADALVDSGGFLQSELWGWLAGLGGSAAGSSVGAPWLGIPTKFGADIGTGIAYDIEADKDGWRDKVKQWIDDLPENIGNNIVRWFKKSDLAIDGVKISEDDIRIPTPEFDEVEPNMTSTPRLSNSFSDADATITPTPDPPGR